MLVFSLETSKQPLPTMPADACAIASIEKIFPFKNFSDFFPAPLLGLVPCGQRLIPGHKSKAFSCIR